MIDGKEQVRDSALWAFSQAIGSADWAGSVVSWWALENGDDELHERIKKVDALLGAAHDLVRDIRKEYREAKNV